VIAESVFCEGEREGITLSVEIQYLKNRHLKDVNPLLCGKTTGDFGPAVNRCFFLNYVVDGEGFIRSGEISLPVKKGNVFLCLPGITTSHYSTGPDGWQLYWVAFETDLDIWSLLPDLVMWAPGAERIFDSMLQEHLNVNTREYYICGKVYELFYLLSEKNRTPLSSSQIRYAIEAKEYIELHYKTNINVQDIATHLHINRSYLYRVFKDYTGKSPREYLEDYRLMVASRLLMDGQCKAVDVARQSGYTDVFSFSKRFKNKYGVSPRAFSARSEDKK